MSDHQLAVLDIRSATYLVTADEVIPLQGALLGWNHEEAREEFHARATAHLRDLKLPSGDWLSELAGLGARLYRLTSLDGSSWQPLFEGIIHEWEPGDGDVTVTASDPLLWFAANDDQVKYPTGQACSDVLKDLLGAYGLPIGTLAGPSASLPAIVFDGKDGDLALKVLQHGLSQGDKAYVLRWKPGNVTPDGHIQRGAVEVVAPGLNDPIYGFQEGRNVLAAVERQSAADMIQEVVVVGNQGDDAARPPIESRIRSDDARLLGGRAILKSADYDSPEAVKKAAETMLAEKGAPSRERSATVVDVPTVRKGDVVRVGARTLAGYYTVLSVSHDADERTMELTLAGKGSPLYQALQYADESQMLLSKTNGSATGAVGSGVACVLSWCKSHLGIPYAWGAGHGPSWTGRGVDCSGFVDQAFNACGLTNFGWGGTDSMLTDPAAEDVSFADRRPGDIVLYSKIPSEFGPTGHVGIVAEDINKVYNAGDPSQLSGIHIRAIVKVRRVKGTM